MPLFMITVCRCDAFSDLQLHRLKLHVHHANMLQFSNVWLCFLSKQQNPFRQHGNQYPLTAFEHQDGSIEVLGEGHFIINFITRVSNEIKFFFRLILIGASQKNVSYKITCVSFVHVMFDAVIHPTMKACVVVFLLEQSTRVFFTRVRVYFMTCKK